MATAGVDLVDSAEAATVTVESAVVVATGTAVVADGGSAAAVDWTGVDD